MVQYFGNFFPIHGEVLVFRVDGTHHEGNVSHPPKYIYDKVWIANANTFG